MIDDSCVEIIGVIHEKKYRCFVDSAFRYALPSLLLTTACAGVDENVQELEDVAEIAENLWSKASSNQTFYVLSGNNLCQGTPSLVSSSSDDVTIWTRNASSLLYRTWNGTAWSPTWTTVAAPSVGLDALTSPVAVKDGDITWVVVLGADHNYYVRKSGPRILPTWTSIGTPTTYNADSPALSIRGSSIDVWVVSRMFFAWGLGPKFLSRKSYNAGWEATWDMGGGAPTASSLAGSVSAVTVGNNVNVVGLGTDGKIYTRTWRYPFTVLCEKNRI